ncbi:hypothetical protein V2154_16765 [Ewingella sp. CoE-038-23]
MKKTTKEKIYEFLIKYDPAEFADEPSSRERAEHIASELEKILDSDK